jgi:solute carrier family 35 protein C2
MCKSSVLGFVLVFAFLFGLEKPSWKLGGIIATMTVGVFLMVAGEARFNTTGFALIMSSAASSGFRWSLTQILLIRHPATSNPFSSIFFLAPIMFLTLFVLAMPVEQLPKVLEAFHGLVADKGLFTSLMILVFPGCLAFMMTASEFALLQRTSVVTLSICGIFKEVLTISTASIVFKDELSTINGIGLGVTILTIGVYNYWKIEKMRSDANEGIHSRIGGHSDLGGSSASILGIRSDGAEYVPVAGDEADEDAERVVGHARAGSRNIGEHVPPGLMKSSLSVGVGGSSGIGRVDSPKPSPVKRPEDLE